jgi:hypothetical protein
MPKGLRASRPGAAYRWIRPRSESWKKVREITGRLEDGPYPFKLKDNRVATLIFEWAIQNLPQDWTPEAPRE